MPYFASIDSVYTGPASEAHPEVSLVPHDESVSEEGFTIFHLADRGAHDIHDELTGFDISSIPGMIHEMEPGSYNPINPIEYILPSVDPMTQMELLMEQGDAWAMEAANSHGMGHPQDHMYDVLDYSNPAEERYHKHDPNNGTTTTTTINGDKVTTETWDENGRVSSTTTTSANSKSSSDSTNSSNSGDTKWWQWREKLKDSRDNDITPESEGNLFSAMEPIAYEMFDQNMIDGVHLQDILRVEVFNNQYGNILASQQAEGVAPQSFLANDFLSMDMSNYLI